LVICRAPAGGRAALCRTDLGLARAPFAAISSLRLYRETYFITIDPAPSGVEAETIPINPPGVADKIIDMLINTASPAKPDACQRIAR
jgi:hypothetical protein